MEKQHSLTPDNDVSLSSPTKIVKNKPYIPYGTIYNKQDEIRKLGYWIPGVPIHAKIINVAKDETTNFHLLNPFLYTIELTHGKYVWQVVRRYKDFSYLSNRLITHRAMERIKRPVRKARSKLEDAIDGEEESEQMDAEKEYELQILSKIKDISDFDLPNITSEDRKNNKTREEKTDTPDNPETVALPWFPVVPDAVIGESHMVERKQRLEKWLQCVLSIPINRDYHETAEFLEVSRYSFINELGGKFKEGELKKRPGGSKVYIGIKNFCVKFILPWGDRWLIIKDTYCCYMNPSNETIRLVLLFDEQFEIDALDLGISIKPKIMVLSNLQHVLATKCSRAEEAQLWKHRVRSVLDSTGSIWLHQKRFGSSYPIRENSQIQWFVDAKDYWEKAAAMLEVAREEIFIADWWICPEIYMKRPMAEGNYWRLGDILQRQAKRGVKIFVLIYKEMEMALTIDSAYSKKYLQELHPNIKVMRHPDHYFGTGTFFWAHHEKLLIIDQLIAFVGGLDLCYGRWDTSAHVLTDLGSVKFATKSEGVIMEDNINDAVEGANECLRQTIDEKDLNETDQPAEVHLVKEDIIDESTGKKIGERTTRTIKSSDQTPEQTPTKNRLRSIAARALRSKKEQEDKLDKLTFRKKSKSRSRSPTPFDNITFNEKTSTHKRPDVSRLFDMQHNRSHELIHTFPFGPVKGIRYKNVQAGRDPSSTPVVTPEFDGGRSFGEKASDEKNGNHTIPRFGAGSSKEPKVRAITMEPHNRTLMRRMVSNLKTNRPKKRWQMILDKHQDDTAEEYVINYCKVQETKVDVSNLVGAGKLWLGKDYVNYLVKDFVDVREAYSDFINRYETPRTPWHDIHSLVYGDVARDVARHFIQRWNATKTEKLKDDSGYPYLLPKSYDSVKVPRVFINQNTHNANIQVVRSVSHWSTLIDKTEDSIQQAYLSLIANANHYIYIENQFFVSMVNSTEVVNEINKALCDRIIRAHRDNKVFRVYILIPLLPGFEGKINSTDYSALLAVLHWTMQSISQGPHSMLEILKNAGITDPSQYVGFFSLRNYDELNNKLVSEQIYIHCKLLIVDDKWTIIGSANINDRSQCGNRDSEVCVVVEDTEFEPSLMNGRPYEAGKFASSLRKRLMSEHLGLRDDVLHKNLADRSISLRDPTVESFFSGIWMSAANNNTHIYEEVFRCYPTNLVSSYEELQAWQVEIPMMEYNETLARSHLKRLRGTLVRFPDKFLCRENLSPTITSKEGLVPSAVFT